MIGSKEKKSQNLKNLRINTQIDDNFQIYSVQAEDKISNKNTTETHIEIESYLASDARHLNSADDGHEKSISNQIV